MDKSDSVSFKGLVVIFQAGFIVTWKKHPNTSFTPLLLRARFKHHVPLETNLNIRTVQEHISDFEFQMCESIST